MKSELSTIKLLFATNNAVNKQRRIFLKQGLYLLSGGVISGCGSSSNSSDANQQVTVKPLPSILEEPSDVTVLTGQSAIFHVIAKSEGDLSYQWIKDGVNIPNATSATYIISLLTLADTSSVYSVEVSNSNGLVLSQSALLTVIQVIITADTTSITIDSTQITVDAV